MINLISMQWNIVNSFNVCDAEDNVKEPTDICRISYSRKNVWKFMNKILT